MYRNSFFAAEPWKRSMRRRWASSASLTATRPPSPSANRFFVGKKLKVEATLVAMPPAANASCSSGIRGAYCALTSTCGIVTRGKGSRAASTHEPVRREEEDSRHDRVVEVAGVVRRLVPAVADRPADPGGGGAEHRAPDCRKRHEPAERPLEDAGGERDERAHEWAREAERDCHRAELLEPPLGAGNSLRRCVQPPSVSFQQRMPA